MIIIKSNLIWTDEHNDIVFDLNNWEEFKKVLNPTLSYTKMPTMETCSSCGQTTTSGEIIQHDINIDDIPELVSVWSSLTFDIETPNAYLSFFFPCKNTKGYNKRTVASVQYK